MVRRLRFAVVYHGDAVAVRRANAENGVSYLCLEISKGEEFCGSGMKMMRWLMW